MQKTKQKQHLMLSVITSIVLTACGNNGSGGTSTADAETKQPTVQTQKATLVGADDRVTYECNNKVEQVGENGAFECPSSTSVSFSIEGLEIGSIKQIPSDLKVYPTDLVGVSRTDTSNSEVQKIVALYKSSEIEDVESKQNTITDTQAVQMTIDSIVLDDSEPLTQSLDLMTEGEYNSTIVWESSNEEILTNEGELMRPTALEGETKVSLVALVSRGDVSERVVFEFRVGVDEGGVL